MNEWKLKDQELIDHLQNKGIQQELNRVMLHPIGLELRLNEENEIEIYKTDDPIGYTYDHINKVHTRVFNEMNVEKQSKRQKLLGFGIQVWDVYRSSKLKDIGKLAIRPSRLKVELIIRSLDFFAQAIHRKIISKHRQKDQNFDPEQFEINALLMGLKRNLEENDWVDVAAFAMMIHQRTTLKTGMLEVQKAAIDYEETKQDDQL